MGSFPILTLKSGEKNGEFPHLSSENGEKVDLLISPIFLSAAGPLVLYAPVQGVFLSARKVHKIYLVFI